MIDRQTVSISACCMSYVLYVLKAPKCDAVQHENEAVAYHIDVILKYLVKQHTEQAKRVDKHQVGDGHRCRCSLV